MSDSHPSAIVGSAIEVLDAVLYLDKKQIVEAEGVRLHPSETHLLVCAVEGMSFTGMARRLAISKGAVSQAFSRLVAKGVVVIDKDRSRKNVARVTLTPLGETLYAQVQTVRRRLAGELGALLADYSGAELTAVARFVADLHTFVGDSLCTLSASGGQRP